MGTPDLNNDYQLKLDNEFKFASRFEQVQVESQGEFISANRTSLKYYDLELDKQQFKLIARLNLEPMLLHDFRKLACNSNIQSRVLGKLVTAH